MKTYFKLHDPTAATLAQVYSPLKKGTCTRILILNQSFSKKKEFSLCLVT